MKNKAFVLVLTGIGLNILQFIGVWVVLQNIMGHFEGYTIFNPNVTNGSTTSSSFVDWLLSMVYSGVPFNYLAFLAIVLCLMYLIPTALFIILEIVACVMIRKKHRFAWSHFILAMGFKNVLFDLSGIPFLVAGLMMNKEQKEAN